MPAVFTFWQTAEDEEALLQFLEATGDVVALPTTKFADSSQIGPLPLRQFLREHQPLQLHVALRRHVEPLLLDEVTAADGPGSTGSRT